MEQEQELVSLLVRSTRDLGLKLTDQQITQFMGYLSQLIQWNQTINLTGITNPTDIVIKHFVDSLTVLAAVELPVGQLLADIGSGAGFPGIPIKILRSDLRLQLIEANHKKCSFLTSLVGRLAISDAQVVHGTVQDYSEGHSGTATMATLRALKFEDVKEALHKLVMPGGLVILFRTMSLDSTSKDNRFRLVKERVFSLPQDKGERVISVLENI